MLTDGKQVRFVPVDSLEVAGPVLERGIVAHDAKPLVRALLEMDLPAPAVAFDTALAAYVVNPAQRTPDLTDLAYRELGIAVSEEEAAEAESGQATLAFDAAGPDIDAAGRRAVAVHRLVEPMTEQVEARGGADSWQRSSCR